MPTVVAFLSMAAAIGAIVILAGATTFSVLVGVLLAAGGLAMGIKGWHEPAMPKSFAGWIGMGAICFGVGAAVYTVECIVGNSPIQSWCSLRLVCALAPLVASAQLSLLAG